MKRKRKLVKRPARIQKDSKKGFYYVKDGNKKIILKDRKGHLINNINKNNIKIVNKIVTEKIKAKRRKRKDKDKVPLSKDESPYRLNKPGVPFQIYFPNYANARVNDADQMIDIIRRLEFKNKLGYDPKYKKIEEVNKELILPDKEKEIRDKISYNDDYARKKIILDKLHKEKMKAEKELKTLVSEVAKGRRHTRLNEINQEVGAIVGNDRGQIFEYARKLFDYDQGRSGEQASAFQSMKPMQPMIVDEGNDNKVYEEESEPKMPKLADSMSEVSKGRSADDFDTLEAMYEDRVKKEQEEIKQPQPSTPRLKGVLTRVGEPIDYYKEQRKKVSKLLRDSGINFDNNTSLADLEELLDQNFIARPEYFAGSGKNLNRPLYDDQLYGLLAPYKDFVGCVMRDELQTLLDDMLNQKRSKFGFIINTDTSKGKGKHWQAVYVDTDDKKEIDFYDSYGDKPLPDVEKTLRKFSSHFPYMLKFKINRIKHQTYNSNLCGWHSSGFLERMFRGSTFVDATDFNHSLPEAIQREKEMRYKKFTYI